MSTNKQALRNSADRDWFEEWFKKEYHPNKTGPYIKDQMFFAIQAARAPLLDELEAAQNRSVELPSFDGYVPHIAKELQAAFKIACATAGISVKGE